VGICDSLSGSNIFLTRCFTWG